MRVKKSVYRLVRTLPDGTEKVSSEAASLRECSQAASYVLYYNEGASKRDAQRFAHRLAAAWSEDDTTVFHHESGYSFSIRDGGE